MRGVGTSPPHATFSALNTVRGAAAVMGEGLERVQEDLASIARLIGSDGETPELRREGRPN
jgi:hypothetical protein